MNSLPSNIGRHTLFRDNENSHTFVFQDSYPLPDASLIKMQVRYNGRILPDIDPEIVVDGQRVTYTYTPEMLVKVPSIVQHYLVLDGKSFLGGEMGVLVGYGQQDITETHVTVTDGDVTVVEVMGMDLVTAQVTIATEKAEQTAADRIQTGQDAATATTKAGEAAGSATAAEEARDTAIANAVQRIDVATFAAAVPYFSGSQPREIYVAADEAYYEGDASWYKYVPGIGEALLGIDFNYKD